MLQQYVFLLFFIILAFISAFLIQLLSFLFSSQITNNAKFSTYECGFEPYEDARNSVDIHFYLIALLFILFDLELAFLLPWISMTYTPYGILANFIFISDFLIELGIGFIYA